VVDQYFRATSGLNGTIFLMLALAILNYGSKLENIISISKGSREVDSSLVNSLGLINETNRRILFGLDMRIFMITIFLSLLFFSISIFEYLCAWGII